MTSVPLSALDKLRTIKPDTLPTADQNKIRRLLDYFGTVAMALDGLSQKITDAPGPLSYRDSERPTTCTVKRDLQERLDKERQGTLRSLGYAITQHFNEKHHVKLELSAYFEEVDTPTFEDIEARVLTQLCGKSLDESASDQIKANFQKHIYSRTVKLGKSFIDLSNYVYWYSFGVTYRDAYEIDFQGVRKMQALYRALNLFEDGNLGEAHNLTRRCGERKPPVGEAIELGYEKITSLTFFKNGKVRVTFSAPEHVQAFATAYDLSVQ